MKENQGQAMTLTRVLVLKIFEVLLRASRTCAQMETWVGVWLALYDGHLTSSHDMMR